MNQVIVIDLAGQDRQFRLREDGYDALRAYLDRARARLGGGPDGAEVVDDLERSIGERLANLGGPPDRVIDGAEIAAVLDAVGPVETGPEPVPTVAAPGGGRSPRKRRLCRIREGQDVAGVCTGLAAYADLRVDWVRTIVILLTIFTAGLFGLVYLALVFLLPVVATRADWVAGMEADGAGAT